MSRRPVAYALGLSAWLLASAAAAQPSASDEATAQSLFQEARALTKDGRHAEACPKFAESQRLAPAIGTQYNLGDCFERTGKLASAWVSFVGVVAATRRSGDREREAAAQRRVDALEPRLTRLKIVPTARHPGMTVTRNGTPVGEAQWAAPVPVDAGSYDVEARAPGFQSWRGVAQVSGEGAIVSFELPALAPAPVGAPGATTEPAGGGLSSLGIVGVVATSVGGLALVGGAVAGGDAMGKLDETDEHCDEQGFCDPDGLALNGEARDAANASTGLFIAGGVLAAGGLVLWLTSSPATEASAARVRLGANGLALRVGF